MFLRSDLGRSLALNPAMQATTGYRPGTTAPDGSVSVIAPGLWSEKAGTFVIQEHTWWQFRAGEIDSDAWRAKIRNAATAAGLPPCPTESVTDNGNACYFGRVQPFVEEADGSISLLAPNTFAVYGVVLGAHNIKNGRFTKSFTPNATQRKAIETAVAVRSVRRFFGGNKVPGWALDPRGYGDGPIKSAFLRKALEGQPLWNPSVDEMLAAVPDMVLYLIYFTRNPVQPRASERTQPGGWASWIGRGGYPLSRAISRGQVSISSGAVGLEQCASILCQCPGGGWPSCVPGKISDKVNFHVYVALHQADPVWELTLVPEEDSWIKEVGEFGEKLLTKLFAFYCGDPAPLAQHNQSLIADKWLTTQGQPCTQGSPGCNRVQASDTTKASVAGVNAIMSYGCQKWREEYAPRLPLPAPQPVASDVFPPPPDEQNREKGSIPLTKGQLTAVVLGGLGFGLLLARRLSR